MKETKRGKKGGDQGGGIIKKKIRTESLKKKPKRVARVGQEKLKKKQPAGLGGVLKRGSRPQ